MPGLNASRISGVIQNASESTGLEFAACSYVSIALSSSSYTRITQHYRRGCKISDSLLHAGRRCTRTGRMVAHQKSDRRRLSGCFFPNTIAERSVAFQDFTEGALNDLGVRFWSRKPARFPKVRPMKTTIRLFLCFSIFSGWTQAQAFNPAPDTPMPTASVIAVIVWRRVAGIQNRGAGEK